MPPGRRAQRCAAAVVLVAAAACGGARQASGPAPPEQPLESVTFSRDLNIDLSRYTRTRSGGYYHDITTGTGVIAGPDRLVTVKYVVYLPDGTAIQIQDTPTNFTIGPDIIRGWREALPGMRVGGVRRIVLPPSLAYGNEKKEGIPQNAVLVFEIELLSVK